MKIVGKVATMVVSAMLVLLMQEAAWACELICTIEGVNICCHWECHIGQPFGRNGIDQIVLGKWDTTMTNVKPPRAWASRLVPTRNGNELHLYPPEPIKSAEGSRASLCFEVNYKFTQQEDFADFRWETREAITRNILEQRNIKLLTKEDKPQQ
jgi:hypothetical protein